MLSLAKVGRGGLGYYLRTVAGQRDERDGLVEPDGAFVGRAAESLGIADLAVDAGSLRAIADGVDPRTGEVLDGGHGRVRVAGFDCTFAAPKSVSLLHALGPPQVVEEVRAAHERSVASALAFLEAEAGRVRRRSGGVERVLPAEGLVAAAFVHRTSRAPDPHLHTHLFVANLGRDGSGRWSALDARPLFLQSRVAGALYRAELRAELTRRLDVAWRWREDGIADLAGVRPDLLRAFSRRHAAILEVLERAGLESATPAARRAAAKATRPVKDLETSYPALVVQWRERAYAEGVSMGQIARVAQARSSGSPSPPTVLRRSAPEVGGRPFTRRDLLRVRSCRAQDGELVAEIVAGVDHELLEGLRRGAFVPDPAPARSAGAMGGRVGAWFPGGLFEQRFVTREYLFAEQEIARMLERAPEPAVGQLEPGLYALRRRGGPFVVAQALAGRVDAALGARARVVALAPGARRAAHAEALLGVEVLLPAGPERPDLRAALVLLLDADCWEPPSLRNTVEAALRNGAAVIAAPGPLGAGRPALSRAIEGPSRGSPEPFVAGEVRAGAPGWRERVASGRGVVEVSLAERLDALVPRFLAECARLQAVRGSAIGVAADASVAGEVGRAGHGETVVVTPPRLPSALAGAPGAGIVVLGGAGVLGRSLRRAEAVSAVPVVHVAVAPATGEPAARSRWVERLVAGRPPAELSRARARALEEVALKARFARGLDGIGR